jgi:hypothetical protein
MLTNPESLCAQVLKAKYFPAGSILEATPSCGISYTWRSILKGCELLKKGLIWRIGDGQNVNMWTDPWINREGSRTPVTPRGQNLLTKVTELIDPVTNEWDETLIRDTFWEMDAECILSTPIGEGFEDSPAWHFDSKGQFSVKSAYHVYVQHRDGDVATGAGVKRERCFGKQFGNYPSFQECNSSYGVLHIIACR